MVMEWVDRCRPEKMAEISESTPDHVACLYHLTTSEVQARGGDERESLDSWIAKAVRQAMEPLLAGEAPSGPDFGERLQQRGLKLVNAVYKPVERDAAGKVLRAARWGACEFHKDEPGFLAVANNHQALARIYQGKKWQDGGWKQSLGRTPGHLVAELKINKQKVRAVLVPLDAVLDESELPDASQPRAREAWVLAQMDGGGV
jgi:hypothetical protein